MGSLEVAYELVLASLISSSDARSVLLVDDPPGLLGTTSLVQALHRMFSIAVAPSPACCSVQKCTAICRTAGLHRY